MRIRGGDNSQGFRKARFLGFALLAASTAIVTVSAGLREAEAQQRAASYSIPAGPLGAAISQFGDRANLQILYTADIVRGKRSNGVSGTISAPQALDQLLAGTGLKWRFTTNNTVTIEDASQPVHLGEADTSGTTLLQTITVTSGAGSNPADLPFETAGSSAYISDQQIENFRGTSVGDFISGVPGVMNGDGRNSGAVDINIRGMQGQGRVPVIVDGASQETSVYQGYNGSTSGSYVDPDFISSVQIEKGPSMGADATGATGGVVRMTTLSVKDVLLPGKQYGIRLKGGFNTNSSSAPSAVTLAGMTGAGQYWYAEEIPTSFGASDGMNRPSFLNPTGGSGSVAVAGTSEFIDVVAAYARRKNGNYHAGKNGDDAAHPEFSPLGATGSVVTNGGLTPYRAGEEVLNTSLDNESWLLKGTVKFDEGHTLELGYSRYSSNYGHILGSQANGIFNSSYQGELSSIDLDTYTARYKWKPEDNDFIDLKVDTFLSRVDNRINATFNSSGTLYPTYAWAGSDRWGITASNTSRFNTEYGDLNFTYGGAFTRENVGLPKGVSVEDVPGLSVARTGSRKEASGFTSLEWKPIDWLTFNGGVRYSHFESLDEGVRDNAGQLLPNFERSSGGWSPSASLLIEPLDGFQLYGKVASALRSPSIFETLQGGSFGLPVAENPIDPERNRSFEVGANYLENNVFLTGDKVRFHAAYFDNDIDNYITRSNVGRKLSNGNISYGILGRVNLDYAQMRGVEATAEYDTGKYFGSVGWNHYTHVMFCAKPGTIDPSFTQCSSGGLFNSFSLQQVPPKDTITVNLGGRFFEDKLTVGSRLTYVGKRFVEGIGDGSENTSSAPGISSIRPSKWNPYTLLDVYASYRFNEHTTLDLAVDNVTDRYYVDALNAIPVAAPGRTVRGSLTLKF